jgi:long-chain acyl-CoA synthetase
MRLISSFLSRSAELYSNRLAVIDGERRYTFREVEMRVHMLVGALKAIGLRKGDRVAIIDVNSSRYLEVYYACAQAGFVLVPLNIRLSPPEIRYILRDCGARVLIVSSIFFETVREAIAQDVTLDQVVALDQVFSDTSHDYERLIASATPDTALVSQTADDMCNIYYTSGTTGEPKGVCLTLGNMTASAWDSILSLGLGSDDVWLHAAPMFHLVDAWAVWSFPLLGATQVAVHFDPVQFMTTVASTRATGTGLPPTLIHMIASHRQLGDHDLSSLRFIMYGGAPTPISLLERASAVLSAKFVHAYGITETSGITTVLPANFFCANGDEVATRLTHSAGYPVANLDLEIVGTAGETLLPGEIGEVTVSGARVMKGYWNKPKHTAEVLKDNRYHTGDMGFLDSEGRLFVVDRKKDMIITGGENVYSVEVENVIAAHPAVMEVAVIGVPDASWGESVKAIVSFKPGMTTSEQDIISFCRGRIAAYKIPKSVDLQSEPLPKIGPGKIAKRKLRDPFWAGRQFKI